MPLPFILFVALTRASAAAQANVGNLTTEYLSDPAAIDIDWNPRPRFAWQVSGALQTAYRIIVSKATAPASSLWDSGTITSGTPSQVPFGGPVPLANDEDFLWTVTVVFDDGTVVTPPPATFGTGPGAFSWAAEAVWLGGCTVAQASPQLRRSFALSADPITRAKVLRAPTARPSHAYNVPVVLGRPAVRLLSVAWPGLHRSLHARISDAHGWHAVTKCLWAARCLSGVCDGPRSVLALAQRRSRWRRRRCAHARLVRPSNRVPAPLP
jgi:hypothetical protein